MTTDIESKLPRELVEAEAKNIINRCSLHFFQIEGDDNTYLVDYVDDSVVALISGDPENIPTPYMLFSVAAHAVSKATQQANKETISKSTLN